MREGCAFGTTGKGANRTFAAVGTKSASGRKQPTRRPDAQDRNAPGADRQVDRDDGRLRPCETLGQCRPVAAFFSHSGHQGSGVEGEPPTSATIGLVLKFGHIVGNCLSVTWRGLSNCLGGPSSFIFPIRRFIAHTDDPLPFDTGKRALDSRRETFTEIKHGAEAHRAVMPERAASQIPEGNDREPGGASSRALREVVASEAEVRAVASRVPRISAGLHQGRPGDRRHQPPLHRGRALRLHRLDQRRRHRRCSPKGDPAGFVKVLDERTLAIPDRLGNRRFDTFRNVLRNPHRPGLPDPGITYTLRISGTAIIVRETPICVRSLPSTASCRAHVLIVDVQRVLSHCPKCMIRSGLWKPDAWPDTADVPSFTRNPESAGPDRRNCCAG